METIAYVTKFVLCSAGVFVLLFFAGWLVWKAGQGYNSYLEKIIELERYVDYLEPNKKNCLFILDRFDELCGDRNKGRKRTRELFMKFCYRFKDVWQEMIKDE